MVFSQSLRLPTLDQVRAEQVRRENLRQYISLENCRNSLLAFVLYTMPNYEVNWHHRLICSYLEKWVRGELPRLIIETPPRHGKSQLVSRHLPAFIFGNNPEANVIATSYSADLASMMNRDVQRLMDGEEYRRVFPDTRLGASNIRTVSGSWLRNSDLFEIVGRKGQYRCAGVGGGITGMGGGVLGGNYAIIDDPIKNAEEANSLTYRDRMYNWYNTTLHTRIHGKPSGILLTLTRWHQDDLAGRLLDAMRADKDADQWKVLRREAIKEDDPTDDDPRQRGEPLWERRFGLEHLKAVKATIPASAWLALFQQNPSAPEGAIIKREWLRYYDTLPDVERWWQSWDLTFDETEAGSYVVGQVWAQAGANCYLVHQYRDRVDFTASVAQVENVSAAYPLAIRKKVEKKANGAALLSTLKNKVPGLVPVTPHTDKPRRLMAVSPLFEAGNVWLPKRENAPWVGEYVEELVTFPKTKYDDQVDATSQGLADVQIARLADIQLPMLAGMRTDSGWNNFG